MLTLRGEHFYLVAYWTVMSPPHARPAPELTWRARFASLRNVRPLLGMVWQTSPPLVLATAFLRLLRALMPLAMLWVSKLILDGVVAQIRNAHPEG